MRRLLLLVCAVVLVETVFFSALAPLLPYYADSLLADQTERAGLEQAFGFALLNAAWAPGHLIGSVAGGALAGAAGDTAPYLGLAGLCAVTLPALKQLA